ncbi:MAG: ATP-binding protein [Gemmatimonadetes bacterium]|nr:ATP-binding protein [Gemmatimonadota bacterium]MYD14549.1 ATP-binding protein [Gemmatimonadota bacterium]MYI66640.1 ATP-binding protein [Gemmatimonadota bacterium]
MITTSEMERRLARTPWWARPRDWIRDDPDLRGARDSSFDYTAGVLRDLVPGGLYLLRGPRRVGKSVEVKKTIQRLIEGGEDPRRILYVAADNLSAPDLRRMVDASTAVTRTEGPRFWFLDEITAITGGWPAEIKWLRDNDPRFSADTVVLTGSSATGLDEAIKALAGRRGGALDSDRVLLPMPFRDFLRLTRRGPPEADFRPWPVAQVTRDALTTAARDLAPWLDDMVRGWEDYLVVGGFPRSVDAHIRNADDEAFRGELLDVVHGEALRRAQWSKSRTDAFVRRLARGLGAPANRADIATDIGGSAILVRNRINALRDAFTVWPCYRERDLRPHLRAQEKVYLLDPVFARLTRYPQPGLGRGILSEQQLGIALLRALERARPGAFLDFDAVLHHRTQTRKEIDFVGPHLGDAAIEAKYVSGHRWRRAIPTIRASRWRGIVATRDALDLRDPEVVAVPAGLLVWLIGG